MKKFVITIGREYGSGGRIIGKKLAQRLGISFYDKNMIDKIAEESGFSREAVEALDGKKTSSFLYSVFMSTQPVTLADTLFKAQTDIIKDLAAKESCIFVGRCADYVLRENTNCINAFVYAPTEVKVKRSKEEYQDKCDNYEMFVRKMDKNRASYYNYYTPNQWGFRDNYDILINSSVGIDNAVNMLASLAESKFGGKF